MITCTENCKYQKNGECTYSVISSKITFFENPTCIYFDNNKAN